ncbi:Uncharacterised protein [Xylophilus ampelinus]|nr:Uncharacterised protein [Xylophilus ampelinus]
MFWRSSSSSSVTSVSGSASRGAGPVILRVQLSAARLNSSSGEAGLTDFAGAASAASLAAIWASTASTLSTVSVSGTGPEDAAATPSAPSPWMGVLSSTCRPISGLSSPASASNTNSRLASAGW